MYHFFVGGLPRSGTTILTRSLAKHPYIFNYIEASHSKVRLLDWPSIVDYLHGKTEHPKFTEGVPAIWFTNIINDEYCLDFYKKLFASEVLYEIWERHFPSQDRWFAVRNYINDIFSLGCKATNRLGWVEKTPSHVIRVHVLYKLFQDIKFIHIIRRPDCLARSQISHPGILHVTDYNSFFENYKLWMKMAYESSQLVPPSQYLTVCLEDILKNPEETFGTIIDFLGLKGKEKFIEDVIPEIEIRKQDMEKEDISISNQCDDWFWYWKNQTLKIL